MGSETEIKQIGQPIQQAAILPPMPLTSRQERGFCSAVPMLHWYSEQNTVPDSFAESGTVLCSYQIICGLLHQHELHCENLIRTGNVHPAAVFFNGFANVSDVVAVQALSFLLVMIMEKRFR